MESAVNFLADIAKRLMKIERRLDEMDKKHATYMEWFAADVRNDRVLLSQIRTDSADIYDRLKTLELNVFPGLAEAVGDLRDVIGEPEGSGHNPLDHRGLSKKNPKST